MNLRVSIAECSRAVARAGRALLPAVLLPALSGGPAASAQHLLVALEQDGPQVVRKLRSDRPQILVEGKMRTTTAVRFGLQPARIYGPGYVSLNTMELRASHLEILGTTARLNYEIEFRSRLSADIDLKDCFLVLDIFSGKHEQLLFVEVPDLEGGREIRVERRLALGFPMEGGRFEAHVFSEGLERLNSKMPLAHIREQRIRTEEFLLRDVADRPARPLRAVRPEYPADLEAQSVSGSARIRCRIDKKGNVVEAKVARATHPAFGEAAAAAVRQWQFAAAIKNHRYVACTVLVPFKFDPSDPED